MGSLSVALVGDLASPSAETCRESLIRFTPELHDIVPLGSGANLGFALRQAKTPFVVFLRDHVAVSPGWAGRLIRALEHLGAGAVGPLSNGAVGAQHRAAGYQDIPGYLRFAERIGREHAGQVQAIALLDDLCVLVRRELLASLDPDVRAGDLPAAVGAAGVPLVVALDTYVHSFAGYHEHARPELVRLIPPDARTVLDVGCGEGQLGAALKQRGPVRVVGVEIDAAAGERARAVLDEVHRGDVESLDLPYSPGAFDCIVLADILEHLRDPWGLLRRLVPLLAPSGGRLIASLPNVRHWSVVRGLLEGEWTYLPAGLLDRAHLRFFTRRSGRALLEAAGLTVLAIHPATSGSVPDLGPLLEAGRSLSLDLATLPEEAGVAQYLYVAERGE